MTRIFKIGRLSVRTCDNLNAQKARILLMLILSVTRDKDCIQVMFETY